MGWALSLPVSEAILWHITFGTNHGFEFDYKLRKWKESKKPPSKAPWM